MPSSPIDRIERARLEKRELRREYRARRRALSPEDRAAWDHALCETTVSLPCFTEAKTLLAYYPLSDEPNLLNVVTRALHMGKTVAFPVCDVETSTMVFRVVSSLEELAEGAFGIHEPTEACPVLSDFDGALCLVPALCFDRRGFRIGYGKGYYDRFLSAHPVQTVGATYDALIADSLPTEPTDRSVSILITERGGLLVSEK